MKKFLLIVAGLLVSSMALAERIAHIELQREFPSITFKHPVDIQDAPDGLDRLFVVEQRGVIQKVDRSLGAKRAEMFLDIQNRVYSKGSETGLLGLAFHPNFSQNGQFYVNYIAFSPLRTVVSRFRINSRNPRVADPRTELILLEILQPYENHNGGQLAFGPDGFLYIATGDGGSAGDPKRNGQSLRSLLGKVLRIDVDHVAPEERSRSGRSYGIPKDNPFANSNGKALPEIFAYGLRNPWRMSFDRKTGALWAADVGQGRFEEVSILRSGGNFGWNVLEGNSCYLVPKGCDRAGMIPPVLEYDHGRGQSITGGYVYRGKAIPELEGAYVYADYVAGWIAAYWPDDPTPKFLIKDRKPRIFPSTFGTDEAGTMYVADHQGGGIYRIVSTRPSDATRGK